MAFHPKHTLSGKPSDLTHDMETIAHLVAETEEIILRSVAPCHVEDVTKMRDAFVKTLANAYAWKLKQRSSQN
ncbi:MAG: hypothetical protein AAGB04_22240 [Pseudomonadota bacterium]